MMIKAYVLKNKNNYSVTILNLGAIIHEINMPDKEGKIQNILHGYKTIEAYENNPCYFGAVIGRVGGRIDQGEFRLNNHDYTIPSIDRGNALHGGQHGFDKKYWDVETSGNTLILSCVSPDGEEGFPGEVKTSITYTLTDENQLILEYDGVSDQDTLLNLTNHAYFNLNPGQSILDLQLKVNSDYVIELNETSIPTGRLMPVVNTAFDFNKTKVIGEDIHSDHVQLKLGGGYDHPWVLNEEPVQVVLSDEKTGRKVTMTSDQNVVVLYSYNFPLPGHDKHMGLAIEFQNDPDSVHHDHFNSCILKKGERYTQKTVYHFEVE